MRSAIRQGLIGILIAITAASTSAGQGAGPAEGFPRLTELVNGLTATARVLIVGAHPDDESSELIAWLSRGRHVETAYLSITRGESGENFTGQESGVALGAIRTQEELAARRIDGAEQFYGRAIDFGFARNPEEVFAHWDRDSVVSDVVAVIRAFRPQVIISVFPDTLRDVDGQHQAVNTIVDQAFREAAVKTKFGAGFGAPWQTTKLYHQGHGLRIDTDEFDPVLGRTYASIAREARSHFRSQGLIGLGQAPFTLVDLRLSATALGQLAARDSALFQDVDTTIARLGAGQRAEIVDRFGVIAASADSARRALAVRSPELIRVLARVVSSATALRGALAWCGHPSANAQPQVGGAPVCDQAALDREAVIDLIRQRASEALLLASGVTVEATSDRELVTAGEQGVVMLAVHNHGPLPATLMDVEIYGSPITEMTSVVVSPDSTVRVFRTVAGLENPHPWWIGKREDNRFKGVVASIDGISRTLIPAPLMAPGVIIPETIRRESDATFSIAVGGATVTRSLGAVVFPYADAHVGLQERPVAGVPPITLRFQRALEWIPRNKPASRALRLSVKSFSDKAQTVRLRTVLPKGLHVDSFPASLTLDAHEQREMFLPIRGKLDITERAQAGLIAVQDGPPDDKGARTFESFQLGFSLVQRDYLNPVRLFGQSGQWIQPVDIAVPPNLTVLYVPGLGDDTPAALKQVGAFVVTVEDADQFLSVDLSKVTAIALGPRALDAHPDFVGQTARLLDYVRGGGTLVVMRGDNNTVSSRLFNAPIALARPFAERVALADAPVTILDSRARVMTWPNTITDADFKEWVSERARYVPTTVDPALRASPGNPRSAAAGKPEFASHAEIRQGDADLHGVDTRPANRRRRAGRSAVAGESAERGAESGGAMRRQDPLR